MAGASARCGAEDAGIATLEVDSGRSCSRRRTSSPAIFEVQGDRFRSYSMFQNLNSAKAYSKSFLKMVSNTVRVLWLLRESVLTSVQRLTNPAVVPDGIFSGSVWNGYPLSLSVSQSVSQCFV